VSVHAGDPELKLGPTQEAIDLWEKIGMPPERIVPLPSSENFWSVGGPGRAGPDSEIYWDWGAETGRRRAACPAARSASASSSSGTSSSWRTSCTPTTRLTDLPKQNIDTGMGLERTRGILQDVASVYDHRRLPADHGLDRRDLRVRYGDSVDATKAHRCSPTTGRGMTFLVSRDHAVERGAWVLSCAGSSGARFSMRAADRHGGAFVADLSEDGSSTRWAMRTRSSSSTATDRRVWTA
jgi:alanyl-tRNA synthetase